MPSSDAICVRTLRQTLLANSDIADLVGNRIYWETAPENSPFPYVVINHISGGEDNETQSRALDSSYKVVAHTADQSSRRTLADAIHDGLHHRMPVTTGLTNALGYTTIEERMPVTDKDIEQNIVFYQVGAIYRIRLSLEAIT